MRQPQKPCDIHETTLKMVPIILLTKSKAETEKGEEGGGGVLTGKKNEER